MTDSSQPSTNAAGRRFLACLPDRYRPDEPTIARLAPKVAVLLANGWTAPDLLRRLTAGLASAHSPAYVLVDRVERFPLPKGVQPPEKPQWCGECDEVTRMREKPDSGLPYRCPDCNPRCVASPPAAS